MSHFYRLRMAWLILLTTCLALAGCSSTLFDAPPTVTSTTKLSASKSVNLAPHASEYGWIHAGCFASLSSNDLTGATVKIIDLQGERILHGRLTKRIDPLAITAQDQQQCFALSNARLEHNLTEGRSFYSIETDSNVGLAIGVLNDARFDFNPLHGYSYCQTTHRLLFTVWEQAPYTSAIRWKDSYYVDDPMIPTCP